jgi:hypothetical protein
MKTWRAVVTLLLAVASSTWAGPVLIYKGMGRQVGKSAEILSGPVNRWVLIDPDNQQVATITFYVRNEQKFLFSIGPTNYRRVIFTLDSGKPSVAYNLTLTLDVNGQYITSTKALHGTSIDLKVSSQQVIPFLHPKTLSGLEYNFADTDSSKLFSDLRFTMTYQQKRTVRVNDAGQSLQQAFQALLDELKTKGFD